MSADVLASERAATLDLADTPNLERIPPLVDVDAHIVEPPDVWSSRLPAKYREIGPHVEYHPTGTPKLAGGTYIEEPGTEGPDVAWWCYEDHQYSVKRLIAAAGYPADDISFAGITFDQMRPAAGSSRTGWPTWTSTACRPSSATRTTRASRARSSCTARTASWRCCACGLQRLDGRGVVRRHPAAGWCRCASCRCGTPNSPRRRCAATPPAGVRAVAFSELPAYLGLPSPHSGYWDPFFRACEETRHGGLHAHRLGHQDPAGVARRARRRRRDHHLRQLRGEHGRLPVLRRLHPLPGAEGALRRVPDRLDPLPARASGRRLGDPPRLERLAAARPAAARPRTTATTSTAASSRTRSACGCSTSSARTTSCSRPTTRIRTAPGRTRGTPPPSSSAC